MKKLTVLFLVFVSVFSLAFAQGGGLPQDEIRRVANSVVLIGIFQGGQFVGNGSGTIVSRDGQIYTNAHVVEDADELGIFMLSDIGDLPELRYFATPVFIANDIDFAIIQIDRDANGNRIDPTTQDLPVLAVTLAQVDIGDGIRVFGYPGIGDGYMVVTSGEIVAIQNGLVAGERVPVWYRTDTEFSGGNSGGLAINSAGEVVGIPTWVVSEERTAGKLGGLLPFSTVLSLVDSFETGELQEFEAQQEQISLQITLENTSDVNICYVLINPTTASEWGPDRLGGDEIIAPGMVRTWDFPPNLYDMLLLDCQQETLSDTREIDLSRQSVNLTFTGAAALVGGGIAFDSVLTGDPIASGVSVTCTIGDGEIVFNNGVEVVVRQMRAGFTYTATVIGIDGFDPVIAVIDPNAGQGLCDDDTPGAATYTANLPSSGAVPSSFLNSQVNFSQSSGQNMADVSLVVGGFGDAGGEFLLVLEGMFVGAANGLGDPFSVRLTPGLIDSGVPLTIYMLATDPNLDPLFYLADPNTSEPFVTSDGEVVLCDDAGNAAICWGDSVELTGSEVTVGGTRQLPGGPRDAMLQIPLDGLEADLDDPSYFTFMMTSYERQTEGSYVVVFHMGTR